MRFRTGTRVPRKTGTPPWILGLRWTADGSDIAPAFYTRGTRALPPPCRRSGWSCAYLAASFAARPAISPGAWPPTPYAPPTPRATPQDPAAAPRSLPTGPGESCGAETPPRPGGGPGASIAQSPRPSPQGPVGVFRDADGDGGHAEEASFVDDAVGKIVTGRLFVVAAPGRAPGDHRRPVSPDRSSRCLAPPQPQRAVDAERRDEPALLPYATCNPPLPRALRTHLAVTLERPARVELPQEREQKAR